MLDLSTRLLYYKRREIQTEIVSAAKDREVGIRYQDAFGKRPDILQYENDVLSSAKKGATSFHISEERWASPMQISTDMRRTELDALRSGWDLVLDIDCPHWAYSKITTYLFIEALKAHGIATISCKFSGNKGFHIGVPFEAFPKEVNGIPIKDWFPDGPKRIAQYLLDYISKNLIRVEDGIVDFHNVRKTTISLLSGETGKNEEELSLTKCAACGKKSVESPAIHKIEFVCPKCTFRMVLDKGSGFMKCPKCSALMDRFIHESPRCPCGSNKTMTEFNPLAIVDVDTILISSRHMFRAPYSLHEKSGLASVPIDPDTVLDFEKEMAKPEKCVPSIGFLLRDKARKDEALHLMVQAIDFNPVSKTEKKEYRAIEDIGIAIPQELFPPCILKILGGLEDGRKRSLFILTNFLSSAGWSYDNIEAALLEWNRKNKEPLKESIIINQVRYHKTRGEKMLPPNCRSYYQDFGTCSPDALCIRVKNPVQYAKAKSRHLMKPKGRILLTEEQKKMRKEYRERLKKESASIGEDEAKA
ncbi:MAG: hypothetical protein HGA85_01840 [Nanoarchaeota archaeon]|nr:hypothetical protein [Nanoarchaeota archaeon]